MNRQELIFKIREFDSNCFEGNIHLYYHKGKSNLIDKSFYIILRNVILNVYESGKSLNLNFFEKTIPMLFCSFTHKIYSQMVEMKTKDEWIFENVINKIMSIINRDIVDMCDENKINMAINYLTFRYIEKEKVSNKYQTEIKILFDLLEEQTKNIKLLAIIKARNICYLSKFIKTDFGGHLAKKYISNVLLNEDPILARFLSDIGYQIGFDLLFKFIVLFNDLEFKLPKLEIKTFKI